MTKEARFQDAVDRLACAQRGTRNVDLWLYEIQIQLRPSQGK